MIGRAAAAVAGGDEWTRAMRRGAFATAWELSDAALTARRGRPCWHRPRHLQYLWDGAPLAGRRVLVRCYHGLGDTVQFARLLAPLHRIAAEVSVWAQPPLLPLLHGVAGIDRLLALHDGTPELDYEVDVELMELAHVFRITPEALGGAVPYLAASPQPSIRSHTGPGRLAVGLFWRGGDWDARRSLPPALLAPLAQIPHVALYPLQLAPGPESPFPQLPPDIHIAPVAELASAIRALDLVITIDSLPAHLAGALGVPVWTLLPDPADWRWMETRGDSPWYPTMRLFRQRRSGDWHPVVAEVERALRDFIVNRADRPAAARAAQGENQP